MAERLGQTPKVAIDYWGKITADPTPAFKKLFEEETRFLQERIQPTDKVLDVCCGSGRTLRSLLPITKSVVGIDHSPHSTHAARENVGPKIIEGDALHMPFPDRTFDVVTQMDTLINFKDKKIEVLREMTRVAKDGGKVIISVYSEDAFENRKEIYEKIGAVTRTEGTKFVFDEQTESEQFSEEEISQMAVESGLQIVEIKKVDGLAYIVELARANAER